MAGEVYVKINGQMHYLWRAVDHEGGVLEPFRYQERDKKAVLKFMKKIMKCHGCAKIIKPTACKTRAGNAKVLADEDGARIDLRARRLPQPLQQRTSLISRDDYKVQRTPWPNGGQWQSKLERLLPTCGNERLVAVGLAAPPHEL